MDDHLQYNLFSYYLSFSAHYSNIIIFSAVIMRKQTVFYRLYIWQILLLLNKDVPPIRYLFYSSFLQFFIFFSNVRTIDIYELYFNSFFFLIRNLLYDSLKKKKKNRVFSLLTFL